MNLTLLAAVAVSLMLAGVGLIYVTLRGNKPFLPRDAFQWAAVGLSSVLVVAAAFILVMLVRYPDSVSQPGPGLASADLNKPAQNFSFNLVNDDGGSSLDAYKGKVVLLNFWATWCQPCLAEMPELNRLQETYADDGLVVLTISDEPRSELLAFDGVELKTISGYISGPSVLGQPFNQIVDVRPISFVIDREGILRRSYVGAGNFDLFSDLVTPYLEQDIAAR
jgi:thiol-disulfide isomerase/thioredoxin